ncbi:hypothetical protein BT96DRAFT_967329 [Gymnopus androsaceus JB14]|uniref:Glycosyltransferase family 18 catalytic domain-containing protein n=1 Tax=Gymnopus androsaceus JB14 TaxID=1447944 RepID=A0A6A4H414_9AGAR|nr:hypothetical protein BT96DRAFT_967329 [Gymnopus androsaceus JB14]
MTFALFATNAFFSQDLSCNALSSFHPSQTVKSTSASRIELLSHLYPGSPHRDNWENENHKSMHALLACMSNDDCTENQTSIVILSPSHFIIAICEDCEKSGEDIWAMSVLGSLREMGYTTFFAPYNEALVRVYSQFPDLVKIIIMNGDKAYSCFDDPRCIKGPENPLGIPLWKILSFAYWPVSEHPLGNSWTLSPEKYSWLDNVYLGYSIERTCLKTPITPTSELPPFPLSLVGGMLNDTEYESSVPTPIVNLGLMQQEDFFRELGLSRVLIGIGLPALSPTPYDALCMGVPFINPILIWDREDPENRDKWLAQHEVLKYESPPYVYNVKRDDAEGLWAAVRAALDNPIERYIVPEMTMESLKSRMAFVVEKDWRKDAEVVLDERRSSGNDEGSWVEGLGYFKRSM